MSSASRANLPYSQREAEELDLGRLLGEFLDNYRTIAVVTVLFTVAALLFACFSTPIYQANALIQLEQRQGSSLLSNLSQILPDSQPSSASEISLLQSRMILGKIVDDLNLQTEIKPRLTPLIGSVLAKLRGKKPSNLTVNQLSLPARGAEIPEAMLTVIDGSQYHLSGDGFELDGRVGELLQGKSMSIMVAKMDAASGTRFILTWVPRIQAIAALQEKFQVNPEGKDSGMLRLTLSGEDPRWLKAVLDGISENYLAQNIARQAAHDAKSLDFLNAQLPNISRALDLAENKLNVYRRQKDSVDLNMEAKSVLEQMANVDNQLNELTFREAEISQFYKKDHPTYRALTRKHQTLQAEKAKLGKRVGAMPSTQQEVLRLSRDVDSGRLVYQQLLSRQQELNVASSSAIGNVRIIDDAVVSIHPVKPNKNLIVAFGFMLGIVISAGFVLVKMMMRQGIQSPEQLEELGVDVYACVPHSDWLSKRCSSRKRTASVLLATEKPVEAAVEALRGLRTSIHFTMMDAKNNVLMISGVSPGSGKTFISSNLAVILAQTHKKVLLIDADLRKGYSHELFGLENNKGLSEILSGKNTAQEAIVTLPKIGIDYISRGQNPPDPAELLMHPRFTELLDTVSAGYDLVIIDTPPVMAVTDAAIMGRGAGTVLMVTHFEIDTIKEIMASVRRFEQNGVLVKGCILNGIKKKYGSYYTYNTYGHE
jgi:tyrosine-protein kinase Etk/Wzc